MATKQQHSVTSGRKALTVTTAVPAAGLIFFLVAFADSFASTRTLTAAPIATKTLATTPQRSHGAAKGSEEKEEERDTSAGKRKCSQQDDQEVNEKLSLDPLPLPPSSSSLSTSSSSSSSSSSPLSLSAWATHEDSYEDANAVWQRCNRWVSSDSYLARWRSGPRTVCTPPRAVRVPVPLAALATAGGGEADTQNTNRGGNTEINREIIVSAPPKNGNPASASFSSPSSPSPFEVILTEPTVVEWRLTNFSYQPQVRDYRNVVLVGGEGGDPETLDCAESNAYFIDEQAKPFGRPWLRAAGQQSRSESGGGGSSGNADAADADGKSNNDRTVAPVARVVRDRVLIRTRRFHFVNPYEGFHAYLNAYVMLRHFNLRPEEVQFVITDQKGRSEQDGAFWRALSGHNHPPLYISNSEKGKEVKEEQKEEVRIFATRVLDAPSSGISLIATSTSGGPLRGRGTDHHCKSSLFREAANYIRAAFGVPPPEAYTNAITANNNRPHVRSQWGLGGFKLGGQQKKQQQQQQQPPAPPQPRPVRILFSSRRNFMTYKNESVAVARRIEREDDFVAELRRILPLAKKAATSAADRERSKEGITFDVEVVDFAALSP